MAKIDPNKRKKLEKIVEENKGKTLKGEVKFFDPRKGFGFILNPHGDVFVHYNEIEGEGYKILDQGEQVEYKLGPVGDDGLTASYIKKLDH